MLLMKRALFLKTTLDGEFESSYFQVDDDHRWYSITRTTRMQEIQGYGEPGERKIAEDDGCGLIWRLSSISRFEERDRGATSPCLPFGVAERVILEAGSQRPY